MTIPNFKFGIFSAYALYQIRTLKRQSGIDKFLQSDINLSKFSAERKSISYFLINLHLKKDTFRCIYIKP